MKALNKEGLHPKFHQLDITDKASIDRVKTFLQSTYGGIDVLVNNAAIAYKVSGSYETCKRFIDHSAIKGFIMSSLRYYGRYHYAIMGVIIQPLCALSLRYYVCVIIP